MDIRHMVNVPDRRSRDHEVVVVRRTINLSTGNLEWGGSEKRGGQFTSNLRPRWTGSYHSKEGFQVSCKIRFETEQNGSERSGKDTQHAIRPVSTRFLLNYETKRWSKANFFISMKSPSGS
jgi:hypothetical protein